MQMTLGDIILRRPEHKDVDRLYMYRNDWKVISTLGGFSTGYSTQDMSDWIESHRARTDEVLWVIAKAGEDECVGHVGLYKIDHRVRSAEFAILIGDREYWGKGTGTCVSRAVLDYGFRQLNLHRISLEVLASHPAAIHLYEKLGFSREGILRQAQFRDRTYIDVVLMGLLEEEWQ